MPHYYKLITKAWKNFSYKYMLIKNIIIIILQAHHLSPFQSNFWVSKHMSASLHCIHCTWKWRDILLSFHFCPPGGECHVAMRLQDKHNNTVLGSTWFLFSDLSTKTNNKIRKSTIKGFSLKGTEHRKNQNVAHWTGGFFSSCS